MRRIAVAAGVLCTLGVTSAAQAGTLTLFYLLPMPVAGVPSLCAARLGGVESVTDRALFSLGSVGRIA